MKELIDYIARYDPAFPGSIQGATPEEIDRLERSVGHALPPFYRAFLGSIGHGLGTFSAYGGQRDFSVSTLIEKYQGGRVHAPERFVMIAFDISELTSSDVFLESLPGAPEPQVVEFCSEVHFDPDENGYSITFESFRQMLFGLAFHVVRLPALGHTTQLLLRGDVDPTPVARAARLKAFGNLATRLGFDAVPQTGGWFPCFEGGNSGILCYQPALWAPFYRVGAATERELNRLAEVLCDGLGLIRPHE